MTNEKSKGGRPAIGKAVQVRLDSAALGTVAVYMAAHQNARTTSDGIRGCIHLARAVLEGTKLREPVPLEMLCARRAAEESAALGLDRHSTSAARLERIQALIAQVRKAAACTLGHVSGTGESCPGHHAQTFLWDVLGDDQP